MSGRPVTTGPLAGIDRLAQHLRFHGRRQQIIAANLANIDTPGYRSRELVFEETLVQTLDADGARSQAMSHDDQLVVADDETPDQDGNTVSLERQLAKMTSNNLRYRGLAEVLSRKLGMLKYAASDGQ